ncbi:MAG: hypothetical protein CM15mP49_05440 [Actinomycetota bacterium]|nr:MAG: hypothetical protein CM15mP49_05440 [Actinomycetota bacterium]
MSEDSVNEDPTETLSIDDIANAKDKVTAAGFVVTDGPSLGLNIYSILEHQP